MKNYLIFTIKKIKSNHELFQNIILKFSMNLYLTESVNINKNLCYRNPKIEGDYNFILFTNEKQLWMKKY